MAEAAMERPGSMAAILGLADEVVERLCRRILGVWPANYNCPGQIVVSGEHDAVDELWVPSSFVRQGFLQSGVPAERVHVVPLGVDHELFRPGVEPLPLPTGKRFRFLFVGGTIHRKGIDVLLEAYARAFTSADDVCLVVKDMGVGTFYRGQTARGLLLVRLFRWAERAGVPLDVAQRQGFGELLHGLLRRPLPRQHQHPQRRRHKLWQTLRQM